LTQNDGVADLRSWWDERKSRASAIEKLESITLDAPDATNTLDFRADATLDYGADDTLDFRETDDEFAADNDNEMRAEEI